MPLLNFLGMEGKHKALHAVTHTVQRDSNHLHLPKQHTAHCHRGRKHVLEIYTTEIFHFCDIQGQYLDE